MSNDAVGLAILAVAAVPVTSGCEASQLIDDPPDVSDTARSGPVGEVYLRGFAVPAPGSRGRVK